MNDAAVSKLDSSVTGRLYGGTCSVTKPPQSSRLIISYKTKPPQQMHPDDSDVKVMCCVTPLNSDRTPEAHYIPFLLHPLLNKLLSGVPSTDGHGFGSVSSLGQSTVPAASLSHSLRHHQHGSLARPTPRDDDIPSESPLTSDDLYTSGTPTTMTPSPEPPTPPRIVDLPVRQHREVHLNCEVTSNATNFKLRATSLMWFHDGRPIDAFILDKSARSGSGLGHRYMRDLLTGQLRIANARLEDEGIWHCEDRDPLTGMVVSQGKPTRLIVLGK
ncbi:hypothetical protein C0J52_27810 [Blattella germanica]|nr:hypothetical protein C0J52_27810 [Blattella germanica]